MKKRSLPSILFLAAWAALSLASGHVGLGQVATMEKENDLLGVLTGDAPGADKAIACKRLAVYGSDAAAAELAKLLGDEKLASWSRIALEAIPGPKVDEALRGAVGSLQGKLLVGTLNSIGVRRDAGAVDTLKTRLQDKDSEVASAAAVALGKIGNAASAEALRQSLAKAPEAVRSAIAEGCVLCAERFLAEGNAAESVAIYDEVRKSDVPAQRVVEATRGAILARKAEGIPLLVETLNSPKKELFNIALATAREMQGREVDQTLATELAKAKPERAALVIQAMADRKDTVQLSAILKAASAGEQVVRFSAINALGRVGDVSCVPTLLDIASDTDSVLAQNAKTALSELPDASISQEILSRLPKAKGKTLVALIEVVGQRRIEATAELLKALASKDEAVRSAALTSLGATVPPDRMSVLITQVVSPNYEEDSATAQQALKAAAVRMPDREVCAAEIASAMPGKSIAIQTALLDILASVGGTNALKAIADAGKSSESALKDASSKLLGDWMTIDAAPVLLELSTTGPADKYQVRSIRGYIRIARQFVMSDAERIAMCQKAFEISKAPAEKKLVLEVLKRYPSLENLKLAIKTAEVAELKDDAAQAAHAIAEKVGTPEAKELVTKAGLDKK